MPERTYFFELWEECNVHKTIWLRMVKAVSGALAAACALTLFIRSEIPDTLTLQPGQELSLVNMPYLVPMEEKGATAVQTSESQSQTLGLFGLIPLKTVHTVREEQKQVLVCGTPFGIKMFADGAMVVGFSDIYTNEGWRNPGKEAGLRMGDVLVEMDGIPATGNSQVQQAVEQANGRPITVTYARNQIQYKTSLQPVMDAEKGIWRIGVWVRDSSAGIGTLTFVDPEKNVYAGLGHSISDSDTGQQIGLLSGEIVPVEITGVKKGAVGSPGELQGSFSGAVMGDIQLNGSNGVYGFIGTMPAATSYPVANKQDVKKGKAFIYTTIDNTGPHAYEVEIEQAKLTGNQPNRDLVVKITDKTLLEKTGGIVQGMSGSPIIQDGKLVGAVTHVLVNDSTRGFGIFAENMVNSAESVAQKQLAG